MPVNPGANLTDAHRRHLLRRAGFGPAPKEMQALSKVDTRGEAADALLDFPAKPFKPGGKDFFRMHNKWFKFMLKTRFPLQSKLVLFWHDHFATGYSKVLDTKLMGDHVRLLHAHAKGNFRTFLKEMNRNAAMMEYLDTVRNSKQIPNENYGRELKELFTLGVNDLAPTPQPNSRRPTSCRWRGPSPAGATTTAAAKPTCRTSGTTSTRSTRPSAGRR